MPGPYPRLVDVATVPEPHGLCERCVQAVVIQARGPQRFTLWCSCARKRPDGGCAHSDLVLADMRPWYRSRTTIKREEGDG